MQLVQPPTGRVEREIDYISEDRRSRVRYALRLSLHYKVLNEAEAAAGAGTTRNLSSSGVAFEVLETLRPGAYVELAIEWPVALNGSVPLKLVVVGRVAWNEGGLAAVRMRRFEFHTQGKATVSGGFALP